MLYSVESDRLLPEATIVSVHNNANSLAINERGA
jgi:hypothetical protein